MARSKASRISTDLDVLVTKIQKDVEKKLKIKITKTQAQQIIAKTYQGNDVKVTAKKRSVIIRGVI